MHTPPISSCTDTPVTAGFPQPQQAECVYRGLTLAAMFLLLASLWLF